MKWFRLFSLLLPGAWLACATLPAAESSSGGTATERYRRTPTGYLMVLRQGDDVFAQLEALAQREKIPGATFTGIGFVKARFGFFDKATKTYRPKDFPPLELASFAGSLAWKNGKPSVHAHGVVTGENYQAFGGHLLAAEVGTGSLEITLVLHDFRLERRKDEAIGADVLTVVE